MPAEASRARPTRGRPRARVTIARTRGRRRLRRPRGNRPGCRGIPGCTPPRRCRRLGRRVRVVPRADGPPPPGSAAIPLAAVGGCPWTSQRRRTAPRMACVIAHRRDAAGSMEPRQALLTWPLQREEPVATRPGHSQRSSRSSRRCQGSPTLPRWRRCLPVRFGGGRPTPFSVIYPAGGRRAAEGRHWSGDVPGAVPEGGDHVEGAAEGSDVAADDVDAGDLAVLDLGDSGLADPRASATCAWVRPAAVRISAN